MKLNYIYNGDCLEIMKTFSDKSVDLVLTDPPYGTTQCAWDTVIPFEAMWEQLYRILRPNGFIIMTASQPFTTKLIGSNIDNFSHQWIWEKEQGANPLLANVMPMKNFEDVIVFSNEYKKYDYDGNNPLRIYFKNVQDFIGLSLNKINEKLGHRKAEHSFYITSTQFELCTKETYKQIVDKFSLNKMHGFLHFEELVQNNINFEKTLPIYPRTYNPQMKSGKKYKSGGGYIKHLGNHVIGGNVSSKRYPTSIIKFNTEKIKSQHPTQKPVALMEYLIKTYTNENETVLDFTMGSGTTGVACKNLNRNFIGIELDENYFEIAKRRLEQEQLF